MRSLLGERKRVLDEEGIRTDKEGIRADEEGIRTDVEGIRTNEEGIRADEEGIRTDEEGIRADEEGIRTDVERIRTDVEGIRADTHACTYGPPYKSITPYNTRCAPLFRPAAAHCLQVPRHIVRSVCTERMFSRFSADNELRHDVTRPNLCRARPVCRTFPAIPIFGKLGRVMPRSYSIFGCGKR
ncbi:hypothetical protein Bbelb_047940 [Branchiostoma belcheri]|nr:hypothetical protein Bbelb_047940 [Branchiostoma belcheri]